MPRTSAYLLKLTPDEMRRLDSEAERRGVTKAAILRAGVLLVSGALSHRPPRDDRAAVAATK